jgi:hypothetical protein
MKVVNEYLAAKDGLTAGEMEEKIEGLVDWLRKKGVSVVTKEDVELLESAEQEEARAQKPGTSNTPATKRCSKLSPHVRQRDRAGRFTRNPTVKRAGGELAFGFFVFRRLRVGENCRVTLC